VTADVAAEAFAAMMDAHPDVTIAFGRAANLLRRARAERSKDLSYQAGDAFAHLVELVERVEGEDLDELARFVLRQHVIEAAWPARLN